MAAKDNTPSSHLLLADDNPDVLTALRLMLRPHGYDVTVATSPAEVLRAVEQRQFDAVLMDLNYTSDTTSGREGLELLPRLKAHDALLPVVVMTAWSSVDSAVEAMRRGARDYVHKPWDNARLLATLATQVELGRALRRGERLAGALSRRQKGMPVLVAKSAAMGKVLAMAERVAPSDASVLITGEHGTGKEVLARWLHNASQRAAGPFIPVNGGGLADGVFDSEVFGHVKGAFTDARSDRAGAFELADGGTIFLDEIGNMPGAQQARLLRVLQTGEVQRVGSSKALRVDVRVLSATNAPLSQLIAEQRFREDMLYRLNTVELHLPPLRERAADVPVLASHFLERLGARYRKPGTSLSAVALQALQAHSWPGNVRELEHVMERALLLAPGDEIAPEHLAFTVRPGPAAAPSALEAMTLDELERWAVQRALERNSGNVSAAAAALGLSRSALYRRLPRSSDPGAGPES